MSSLIIKEVLHHPGYPQQRLCVDAYENAIGIAVERWRKTDTQAEQSLLAIMTDQNVDDVIVALEYYKHQKIASGRKWEGTPNGTDTGRA